MDGQNSYVQHMTPYNALFVAFRQWDGQAEDRAKISAVVSVSHKVIASLVLMGLLVGNEHLVMHTSYKCGLLKANMYFILPSLPKLHIKPLQT